MSLDSYAPDPRNARTPAEFVAQLRRLKAWSGLTYRQLERAAAEGGEVLPHSTVATALSRESLPRTELVRALVRACGCGEDTVDAWVGARQRLAAGTEQVSAFIEVPHDHRNASGADPRPTPSQPQGVRLRSSVSGHRRTSRRAHLPVREAGRLIPILLTLLFISASASAGPGEPTRATAPDPSSLPVPAAWWRFEETGGPTAYDSSAHGANAIIRGGATRIAVPGGHALEFDGGGSVVADGPIIRTDEAFTITAWVRLDVPDDWGTVVSEHAGAHAPDVVLLDYDQEHTDWAFMFPDRVKGWAVGNETVFSGTRPVRGRWTHLAVVFALGDRRVCIYVDRTLEACRTRATINRAKGPLEIGRALAAGEPVDGWHGAIDDVRVFARALTRSQIEEVVTHRA